ncbi:hypothetical protein A9Q84_05215 [Halobacteriovorax marinus]|uniref:Glycosyl transferase family 1 domain-containing protein n=1 Tax=Halobacteriovorax marinus TaxID=97084 RepID=A0A1Y5FF35_9BACT|nr:hypothetical protein A9Q84_05215 [Halobacteriovorax marinus]
MSIVLFTDEYQKITKGMYLVFETLGKEISNISRVTTLVNKEHWCKEELEKTSKLYKNMKFEELSYPLPSTIMNHFFSPFLKYSLFTKVFYVLGHCLNFIFLPLIIVSLIVTLKKCNTKSIISHNGGWPGSPISRWILIAAKILKVKNRCLIIHSHPAQSPRSLSLIVNTYRKLEARLVKWSATEIMTVSDSVKDVLETSVFNIPLKRIYNGISIEESVNVSITLDYSPKFPAIGFVGAVNYHKGTLFLLDGFKRINEPCELALLGPGEKSFLKILKEKSIDCKNPVHFLGFHNDVDIFLNRIDFLVVPSIAYESFGMVILEAMRQKKAVICTDFGGMKEIVVDGETGFVVRAGDEVMLADKITKLLKNKELATTMGINGYNRFKEYFSSKTMCDNYLKIINS